MKKDEPAETPDNSAAPPQGHYPGLHGKVVDWADHCFEDGLLFLRVRFIDQSELCWTIKSATVITEADLCNWKTGNQEQLKIFTKGETDW